MIEPAAIVYVVDDDPSIRRAIKHLVESVGLHVELFASPAEFLNHHPRDVPSCLITDIRLPGMSGLDLQRKLLQTKNDIPIIFITAHGDIPMSVRAMKARAVEFLTKPFRDQDLLDAVQAGLERNHVRRQRLAETALLRDRLQSLTPREREVRWCHCLHSGLCRTGSNDGLIFPLPEGGTGTWGAALRSPDSRTRIQKASPVPGCNYPPVMLDPSGFMATTRAFAYDGVHRGERPVLLDRRSLSWERSEKNFANSVSSRAFPSTPSQTLQRSASACCGRSKRSVSSSFPAAFSIRVLSAPTPATSAWMKKKRSLSIWMRCVRARCGSRLLCPICAPGRAKFPLFPRIQIESQHLTSQTENVPRRRLQKSVSTSSPRSKLLLPGLTVSLVTTPQPILLLDRFPG